MPILSRKDLERISRRVLFRYLTLSDRKMDRIDPVDFAEKICGLHFAFADMSITPYYNIFFVYCVATGTIRRRMHFNASRRTGDFLLY